MNLSPEQKKQLERAGKFIENKDEYFFNSLNTIEDRIDYLYQIMQDNFTKIAGGIGGIKIEKQIDYMEKLSEIVSRIEEIDKKEEEAVDVTVTLNII